MEVCVDASLTLRLLLPEAGSDAIQGQWAVWRDHRVALIAPWLWLFETHAVLRRKVARRELNEDEAEEKWREARRLGIRTVQPRLLFERAWALARELGRPTTYDTVYLAVAEIRGCELWTADRRLVNAAAGRLPWLRALD